MQDPLEPLGCNVPTLEYVLAQAASSTHRSRLLGGWVAGEGHQILERVLGVEMRRVPDGCVWKVGGGRLRQDGRGREVQR